jgi:N-acetylglutamate synthase-like GNAT family acetyltransferase
MIALATKDDLTQVEMIMKCIKEEMKKEGNPQWGSTDDDYPSITKLLDDIEKQKMIKYVEDDQIKGIVSLARDIDREYDGLIDNHEQESIIIHRLAVPVEYRKQNIATKLIRYAEVHAKNHQINVLKSSTEVSNFKMNNFLQREGFIYKGEYTYDDYPGVYSYYEKEI